MAGQCRKQDYTSRHQRHKIPPSVPYNIPLSVETHVEYKLDQSKFPGLESGQTEPSLLIAKPQSQYRVTLPRSAGPIRRTHRCRCGCMNTRKTTSKLYVNPGTDSKAAISLAGEYSSSIIRLRNYDSLVFGD